MTKLGKVFIAELLGTFIFLGVIIHVVSKSNDMAWIKIGLTLAVVIVLLGSVSGGKFNPAVSFMFLFAGKTPTNQFLIECGAQLLGALGALYLYKLLIQ